MNLQFLFKEQIREIVELSPGYDDHGSDVWLVKTDNQEVIVRSSRMEQEPSNDFWWGCKRLFGIDPRKAFELEYVNYKLSEITTIPIPRVINKGKLSKRVFIVVEKLKREVIKSFIGQPSSVLQSFGEGLAKIHYNQENYIGSPSGNYKIKLEKFNDCLKEAMDELISKFYANDEHIKRKYLDIRDLTSELPIPEFSSFVLVGIDST